MRTPLSALATISFFAAFPDLTVAKTYKNVSLQTIPELTQDESIPTMAIRGGRINSKNGFPITLYGVDYDVGSGTPQAQVNRYLQEQSSSLGVDTSRLSQNPSFTWTGPAGTTTTVRYTQHDNGVPVYDSAVAVTVNSQAGNVVFYSSSYKDYASFPAVTRGMGNLAITEQSARNVAIAYLGLTGQPLIRDLATLVVYASSGSPRLAWKCEITADAAILLGGWEILVDATSGEIVKAVDTDDYATGTAQCFDTDPLIITGATYGDPGFVDNADADSAQLTANRQTRSLLDIEFSGGLYRLVGPWAQIVEFEATNVSYHIDQIMRYINLDLELNIKPYQYSGGVKFDPHGVNGADRSVYNGNEGVLVFGEGGVDDAEDADIIIHELGHGLHDWITNDGLSERQGLSEGVADYTAASYKRSLDLWTTTDPEYHHLFSWDGHNEFWDGRTTNPPGTYPGSLNGRIHHDGQYWAKCNMLIWDAIGREKADTIHWSGLAMTSSTSNQNDAANAVYTAASASPGLITADELKTICSTYDRCGYTIEGGCPGAPTAQPTGRPDPPGTGKQCKGILGCWLNMVT
jgi:Zn-dependent metalloprotease